VTGKVVDVEESRIY